MTRRRIPDLSLALALSCLQALPAAAGAAGKTAAADADEQAVVAEERDRLAREKRELAEREALLRKQLEMQRTLKAQQDALIEQLRRELQSLGSD